jgi:hypothetical protein
MLSHCEGHSHNSWKVPFFCSKNNVWYDSSVCTFLTCWRRVDRYCGIVVLCIVLCYLPKVASNSKHYTWVQGRGGGGKALLRAVMVIATGLRTSKQHHSRRGFRTGLDVTPPADVIKRCTLLLRNLRRCPQCCLARREFRTRALFYPYLPLNSSPIHQQ